MTAELSHPEAERALIARLLLDPVQIPLVSGDLTGDDFAVAAYGEAFRAMVKLAEGGQPVDIVTLQAAGADVDPLDLTGAHHGPLESYAAIIRGDAFRRKVVTAAKKVERAAERAEGDLMAVIQTAFAGVISGSEQANLSSSSAAVDDYLIELTKRMAGVRVGLTYGIPGLDRALNPALPGDLLILAARPGVGKSAMALAVAHHWATLGDGPVLFVSLEMTRNQLMDRLTSRVAGVSAQKIIKGSLTDEEKSSVDYSLSDVIRGLPIHYLDNRYSTSATVRSTAARVKMQNGGKLAAIVVDYIGILKDQGDQEVQRIGKITGQLKALAGEAGCPVLALSQLNRQVEMRGDKHPGLSDLRDSGAVEQDADIVIALTRRGSDVKMDIEILKQRQGQVGRFSVRFDGDTSSFYAPGAWGEGLTQKVADRKSVV